ncbi:MAG: hypothetical protein Q9159_003705 [Coniocarpon cinnabarinum]
MASNAGQIIATPLQGDDYGSFNWIFLIEYILCGILCLWFLFYFNRIFATLISYLVRLFTWHFLGAYIDIEALQISILAGRVFFKSIRYHGDNETIFLHGGYITWRYWLRKVKPCPLFREPDATRSADTTASAHPRHPQAPSADSAEEATCPKKADNLPCRIDVRVSGVEAFLYNRSPAYDYILEACHQHGNSRSTAHDEAQTTQYVEKTGDRIGSLHSGSNDQKAKSSSTSSLSSEPQERELEDDSQMPQPHPETAQHGPPPPPTWLRLLPVSIHCNKAAAVLGNENTPSILTAKIDTASGEFDASTSGPLDIFKILMTFSVKKPLIQLKPNIDYKRPQLAEAALLEASGPRTETSMNPGPIRNKDKFTGGQRGAISSPWNRLPGLSRKAMSSLDSIAKLSGYSLSTEHLPDAHVNALRAGRWLGLARYLDDTQRSDEDAWKEIEYAKASTLADFQAVDFKFYWDVAGPRPKLKATESDNGQATDTIDVNGSQPPEYGMELFLHGGTIHYGPWADRHRLFLQQLFFPTPVADAAAVNRVQSGSVRLCTVFELFCSVESDTVLRIPFREPSKDYKWRGRAEKKSNATRNQPNHWRRRRNAEKISPSTHSRPFAWFDILVKPNTTIEYRQDMFPTLRGYRNHLRVDIGGIDMHSSLNHALLWRSGAARVEADLSNPLKWNALHEWTFEIGIEDLDFFLLRDHAVLLMDMIEDWTTGPEPEFFTFVPYRYILKPKFDRFKLFLNVNDANIVDQSDDINDNDFVILYGRELRAELLIPIDRLRPSENTISFDVIGSDLGFELSMPPKNTLHTFLKDKDVAQLPRLDLKGEYVLLSEVRADLCETLNMKIVGKGLTGIFYGFFGRHLAKIKENYFGEQVHFRTLQEYQELVRNGDGEGEPQAPVRGNDLDVILDITAEDAHVLLPAGLYCCEDFLELSVDAANVDLRVNNYYLELIVDSSPLQIRHGRQISEGGARVRSTSETQVVIDRVNVYGHRLFGMPPSEPAYVSEWDIVAGDIFGQCSDEFVAKLTRAGQALALTMTDEENALPIPESAPISDATIIRWRSGLVRIWLAAGEQAVIFNAQDIHGFSSDLALGSVSQNLLMRVPLVVLACVDIDPDTGKPAFESPECTRAYFKTYVTLRMIQRAANFHAAQMGQLEHIARHDARTLRSSFLSCDDQYRANSKPPSLCLPSLPGPLKGLEELSRDLSSSLNKTMLHRVLVAPQSKKEKKADDADYLSLRSTERHSVFTQPYLPSESLMINAEHVPNFSEPKLTSYGDYEDEMSLFNLAPDDSIARTSIAIETSPGVVALCSPNAILAMSKICETVSTKDPSASYDQYQIDVTSAVISVLRTQRGQRHVVDLGIQVPFVHARFINSSIQEPSKTPEPQSVDEYNLMIFKSSTAIRIKNVSQRRHADNLKAVHIAISSISLSAKPMKEYEGQANVALHASLSNTLVWLAECDRTIVNASFDDLDTSIAGQELRYLAALIHRAASLGQDLALPFVNLMASNAQRRRFIVYSLVKAGHGVPDPSFLTRPSYMIRSAEDHLRNTDSWRVVARLRWILHCLSEEETHNLLTKCLDGEIDIPERVEKYAVGSADQWRSWDALHISDSLAMKLLTGRRVDPNKPIDPESTPLSISVHGSDCRIWIDHGHNQNGVTVSGVAVAVSVIPPPPPSAMQMFQEYRQARLTTVHFGATKAVLNTNWELCGFVDDIAALFEEETFLQKSAQISQAKLPEDVSGEKWSEELHVIVQMETAEANFETINIAQMWLVRNFRTSTFRRAAGATADRNDVNVIASAQEASMRTFSSTQLLLETNLQYSSLAITYGKSDQDDSNASHLHLGGTAGRFDLQVHHEPAELLEVASKVAEQEVRQGKDVADRHAFIFRTVTGADTPPVNTTTLRPFISLVLDAYSLSVPMVQDLRYCASGSVLRLGVAPTTEPESSHEINFDLKSQEHTLLRGDTQDPLAKAAVKFPPINGGVRLLVNPNLMTISTSLSIERIELQGLALYSIFSMISSPGVLAASQSLGDDIESFMQIAKASSASHKSPESTVTSGGSETRVMIFDASLSLVGISIAARTHQVHRDDPQASIVLAVESTHLRASNRSEKVGSALPSPEMHLSLGQMSAKVERQTRSSQRESANLLFAVRAACTMSRNSSGNYARYVELAATGPAAQIDQYTSPIVVSLMSHFQERMKKLTLSRERHYIRRLRQRSAIDFNFKSSEDPPGSRGLQEVPEVMTSCRARLTNARLNYVVKSDRNKDNQHAQNAQNLTFSLESADFETHGERDARLRVQNIKLQVAPQDLPWTQRSVNSALLPELVFTVKRNGSVDERRLHFRAGGKALDIQLHPDVVQPAATLTDSVSASAEMTRRALTRLRTRPVAGDTPTVPLANSTKRLSLLTVDVNFAGAVVRLQEHDPFAAASKQRNFAAIKTIGELGRYRTPLSNSTNKGVALRAPGLAARIQFDAPDSSDPRLNIEIRIDKSKNVLTPAVVPLVMEFAHNVKKTVNDPGANISTKSQVDDEVFGKAPIANTGSAFLDESFVQQTPRAVLGRTRLNIGVGIGTQDFALVCQPIAKVEACMKLEDSYMTISTVTSSEAENFFALSVSFTGMQASLQHVYSREATFKFDIDSIILSALNSKHTSGKTGVSAILKVNPMKAQLNAKQLQDVLLFREIWFPPEIRDSSLRNSSRGFEEQQEYFVARYRQIAAATSFPWNATVVIADLGVDLDLGQAIGKLSSHITGLWASSKKTTSSKQTLCVGIEKVVADAYGRMSGFILLKRTRVRTSISWPDSKLKEEQTPLVQGSIGFDELRVKAAFDYQVFAVLHIASFDFIMYNVRDRRQRSGDRLVAILDGKKVHAYCVASSAALAVSLSQAFERLIQEKQAAYEQSLRDIDNFLRRKTSGTRRSTDDKLTVSKNQAANSTERKTGLPISLHTDVMVTLGSIDLGAFPRTVMDQQILRLEASDVQARFAVLVDDGKLHSGLGLTLGQVRTALAEMPSSGMAKPIAEVNIDDVVSNATSARGGIILRVPKVLAEMQTWQVQDSRLVEYKFRSTFEGKIDVGWNYSRISFIRGMWATHTRTLATRLGKPLPESALKISGPQPLPKEDDEGLGGAGEDERSREQAKITVTANVSLPNVGYEYRALEPAVIDTPQLRDMGEATPPLEWIGLHRDKLPNVTHQVVIVTLLEVAKEVEDTYNRILGSA